MQVLKIDIIIYDNKNHIILKTDNLGSLPSIWISFVDLN